MKKLQDENSNTVNVTQSEYEMRCRDYEDVSVTLRLTLISPPLVHLLIGDPRQHIANLNHANLSLEEEVSRLQSEVRN